MLFHLFLIFVSIWWPAHPYHASLTTVSYQPHTQEVQITVKLFVDDVEKAISLTNGHETDWSRPDEQTDSLLNGYVQRHLKLTLQTDQPLRFHFIGKEVEQDVAWCYFQATDVKAFSQISVRNSLLTSIFDDQINLVRITKDDQTKSLMLKKAVEQGQVIFK